MVFCSDKAAFNFDCCPHVSIRYIDCDTSSTFVYVDPAAISDPYPSTIQIGSDCYTNPTPTMLPIDTLSVDAELSDCADCSAPATCPSVCSSCSSSYTATVSGFTGTCANLNGAHTINLLFGCTWATSGVFGLCTGSSSFCDEDFLPRYTSTIAPFVATMSCCPSTGLWKITIAWGNSSPTNTWVRAVFTSPISGSCPPAGAWTIDATLTSTCAQCSGTCQNCLSTGTLVLS